MKSRYVIIAAVLVMLAGIMFLAGCTDKTDKNPTREVIANTGLIYQWSDRYWGAFCATDGNPGFIGLWVYTPPGYNSAYPQSKRYPTLYLLAPFRGDERYYFEHGLATVADRLIAEGKIQPMIIVGIDGTSQLGGSFYVNSGRQGQYFTSLFQDTSMTMKWVPWRQSALTEHLYQQSVVSKIEDVFPTLRDRNSRGIGGVGMGGYGAFRGALETDLFSSVSAVNAPLDFDGSGNNGFISLFQEIFPSGTVWSTIGANNKTIYTVDTSLANPDRSLVVSAAAAFSPHELIIDSTWIKDRSDNTAVLYYHVGDTLETDRRGYLPDHLVHLPFDSTGTLDPTVWGRWLANSFDSLYNNATASQQNHFGDIKKLLISSGTSAEYHFGEQMSAFIATHRSDTTYTIETFKGTTQLTGTSDHFLYDLLEDILIFHSKNFQSPY